MKRQVLFITCLLLATLLVCTDSYADDAYVTFGTYPQTNAGNDSTPIEWLVLDYDEVNNRALLISQYGLDAQPYNADYKSVTWETCTLRAWLNNDFYNRAFSVNEQIAILLTNVDNSKSQGYGEWNSSGGNDTEDKVFLLSYSEANKYLGVTYDNIRNMEPRVSPTAYAKAQRAYTNDDYKTADGAAAGRWWLRSPGNYNDYAAYVFSDGALYYWTVNNDSFLVRPALWVNLDSDIFMTQQSLNPQFNR